MKVYKAQFTTKYLLILSSIILLVSLLTFLPVNTLFFVFDILGYICRYGSIFIVLYLILSLIKIYKHNEKKDNKIIISAITLLLSLVVYFICFYLNVVCLFF